MKVANLNMCGVFSYIVMDYFNEPGRFHLLMFLCTKISVSEIGLWFSFSVVSFQVFTSLCFLKPLFFISPILFSCFCF